MIQFSLSQIDRSLYNHLRMGLVYAGMLPDISDFIGTGDNDSYQMARTAIKQHEEVTGIPLIDIFGVGTGESREAKTDNKLILNRSTVVSGSIGSNYTSRMEKDGNKWVKKRNNDSTIDITYEIRTLADKTAYDRQLTEMVFGILGTSRFLYAFQDYDLPENKRMFYVEYGGDVNVSAVADTIERMYRITVRDVFLAPFEKLQGTGSAGDTVIRKDIVPLTSVHYKVNLFDDGENLAQIVEKPDIN